MDLLRSLLEMMEPGIWKVNPRDENCKVTVTVTEDKRYSLSYNVQEGGLQFDLKMYLVGDLKFLFMMLGRDGFSGSWCLYCSPKQSEWKKQHSEFDSIHCGAEEWTISKLSNSFLIQQQPDATVV
jgi:hypothetical protein